MDELSLSFDKQVTLSPKPKSQLWMEGLSPPFDQQVTLSPKHLVPNFGQGVVSNF